MANRRLQLRHLAAALEQGRELPAAVHRRLLEAVRAALDGEGKRFLSILAPDMDRADMEARNARIIQAREALGGVGHEHLAREAAAVEERIVSGELDPDRPGRWPAMREHEQHLAHAVLRGPMISRSQFYAVVSGPEPDRTPCDDHSQVKQAMERWSRNSRTPSH